MAAARRTATLALAALFLGCSLFRPTDGNSADEAIRIAGQHAGPTAVFVSIEQGMSGPWAPSEPSRPVRVVRFSGDWPMECPAPAPGFPRPECPNLHHLAVVLDLATGDFIAADYG